MRYALMALLVLALALVVVLIIGWRLPVGHVATREIAVAAPVDTVYALVSTVDAYPRWRDVKRVERLDSNGVVRFREHGSNGPILFEVAEAIPPRRFVTRIADPTLPFGGKWTYEIAAAAGGGSTLRITEDGEVYNPLFRFVSRYVMGHTATMDSYLADVSRALTR